MKLENLQLLCAASIVTCVAFTSIAAPRAPQPPWPQATLKIFGFDSQYGKAPWRNVAINEEESTLVESWSGYALERSGLFLSPVVIPVRVSDQELNIVPACGAIRFWFAPNWSTANEQGAGKGPGHLAHLLELVNLGGKVSDVNWALFVNESGDTLHLVGQTPRGLTEILQAPVAFTAGDWRMITLCYPERFPHHRAILTRICAVAQFQRSSECHGVSGMASSHAFLGWPRATQGQSAFFAARGNAL